MIRLPILISVFCLAGLLACSDSGQTPSSSGQQSPARSDSGSSPESAPYTSAYEQDIQQRLAAYYRSLEEESIRPERFFAPTVKSFFGKELSREKVGESLINGFADVENRTLRMDPVSLRVRRLLNGGYEAEFSGQVSFIRTESREEVHDVFHNRVTFNEEQLITRYESLPVAESPQAQRSVSSQDEPKTTAEFILSALQQGNLDLLNAYLPTDMEALLIIRSGAYTFPSSFSHADQLAEGASWMTDGYPALSTRIQPGDLPDFDCDNLFSKEGTFLGKLVGTYNEISSLMVELQRAQLDEYSDNRMNEVKEVEQYVSHRVVDTQTGVSFCLGQVQGGWKLLVVDLASYDCSA